MGERGGDERGLVATASAIRPRVAPRHAPPRASEPAAWCRCRRGVACNVDDGWVGCMRLLPAGCFRRLCDRPARLLIFITCHPPTLRPQGRSHPRQADSRATSRSAHRPANRQRRTAPSRCLGRRHRRASPRRPTPRSSSYRELHQHRPRRPGAARKRKVSHRMKGPHPKASTFQPMMWSHCSNGQRSGRQ